MYLHFGCNFTFEDKIKTPPQNYKHLPGFIFVVSESDLASCQLLPGEGVIPAQFSPHLAPASSTLLLILAAEQDQPAVTRLLEELKDQLLRWAVQVLYTQQAVGQWGKTTKGNQQGTIDMQFRGVGVHWETEEKETDMIFLLVFGINMFLRQKYQNMKGYFYDFCSEI